jgi:exopolyphosphatase/pppGpp-phosphohydrolase
MRCTVLDQGGGSVELASATWTGKTVADLKFETFDDLGSTRLAKVYASNGSANAKAVQGLLEAAKERVELYGRTHKIGELFGLGSALV